ncbi:type II toxin-antitoxin system RelE/ParE family toxin [Nocardiopsis tropica]|uniref:Type II toxin-antitoxin system RelE/ParE family toxin n=1 Tax=Nocardiopsis tropica TaxID=109330 RepID=A0ABU7L4P2_9ACTN|nr:type II toxin-antitoxin system RelE/ParE family toxin [Nocardiopsis umidischolae]MEE2055872.1 type II toxin-antitoxin system RelE/ParE family toxin [Nocardiopsis umidischolae]
MFAGDCFPGKAGIGRGAPAPGAGPERPVDGADGPRPDGCRKLEAGDGFRVRVGDYRVVCTVDDGRITVVVVKVGSRGDVYGR